MFKLNLLTSLIILATKAHTLPIYPAEIVGRDLALWGLGWAGHVGITTANDISEVADHVIEVMNDTPVIQVNTLANFKSRTSYWGARYGIADRAEGGTKILNEANFQRGLCPIYTATAAFEPGTGYDAEGRPTRCAVFRCDTFVNYIFHIGGYDLPTYNSFTIPLSVYNSFPKAHDDNRSLKSAQKFPNPSYSGSLIDLNLSELEQLSFEEFMLLIDSLAEPLPFNEMKKAWEFSKNPNLSIEKRIYLADFLGLRGTVELIPLMVEEYPKVDHQELKSMLLRSTFTLQQKYSCLQDYPKEKELLREFYADLLTKDLSNQDKELVLRGYMNLSSIKQLIDKMNQLNTKINQLSNPQASFGLWLELLMKSKTLENQAMPEIISILNQEANPDLDDLFNQFIVRRLSQLGPDTLLPESKSQIKTYLNSITYRYNSRFSFNLNRPYYGAWLEAKALVETNSQEEAALFVAQYIKDKPLKEREKFVSGLSHFKLKSKNNGKPDQ